MSRDKPCTPFPDFTFAVLSKIGSSPQGLYVYDDRMRPPEEQYLISIRYIYRKDWPEGQGHPLYSLHLTEHGEEILRRLYWREKCCIWTAVFAATFGLSGYILFLDWITRTFSLASLPFVRYVMALLVAVGGIVLIANAFSMHEDHGDNIVYSGKLSDKARFAIKTIIIVVLFFLSLAPCMNVWFLMPK